MASVYAARKNTLAQTAAGKTYNLLKITINLYEDYLRDYTIILKQSSGVQRCGPSAPGSHHSNSTKIVFYV